MTLVSGILCVTPIHQSLSKAENVLDLNHSNQKQKRSIQSFPPNSYQKTRVALSWYGKIRLQLLTPEQGTVLPLSGKGTSSLWHRRFSAYLKHNSAEIQIVTISVIFCKWYLFCLCGLSPGCYRFTSINVSGMIRCKVEEGMEKQNKHLYLPLVYLPLSLRNCSHVLKVEKCVSFSLRSLDPQRFVE